MTQTKNDKKKQSSKEEYLESIVNTMTLSLTKEHSMNSHYEDLGIMPLKSFQEPY